MTYAKREPLASRAALACRRSPSPRRTRRGRARGASAACRRRRAHAPRRRPRRRRAPTRRPGSAPAARARAASASASASSASSARELLLQRAARRRSSPAARRARPCRSPSTPRSAARAAPRPSLQRRAARVVGREHLVDQAGARRACARCRARYSGSSRSRLRSITRRSSSRICARSSSTHVVASRHALVDGASRRDVRRRRPADRVRAEELHLGLLRREVAQAVGDELVGDVALEVDEEAVVAEARASSGATRAW